VQGNSLAPIQLSSDLQGAKLARYAGKEQLTLLLFVSFAVSWVALRVCAYYWMVIHHILHDVIVMVSIPYKVHPQPLYAVVGSSLVLLYILHLNWTCYLFLAIARQLRTGKADDVREESDKE
jgi:isoprenylcysteine carboxyl methyltransferase (ICMT) family protein YpbQ